MGLRPLGLSGPVRTRMGRHLRRTKQRAIAKSLTAKEDSRAQDRGKLASIGRLEERLVFLLKTCDTLNVTLCPGVVGKELYHAVRIAGTQARPQLRQTGLRRSSPRPSTAYQPGTSL